MKAYGILNKKGTLNGSRYLLPFSRKSPLKNEKMGDFVENDGTISN